MEIFGNEIKQKISRKYCCEICDYNTNRKSNLSNHLLSAKHLKELNGNEIKQKLSTKHNCKNCSKIYETSAGLWKHNKKCFQKRENITEPVIETENNISSDLILNIIQQNQEFKDLLLEQNKIIIEMSKNNGTTNINNSMNNSHNKTFNLQLFLNETCKDAMNIMDFVDSLKIQLSDIESIGELGFVNGISKFIIKNLKALDENMRPVHCSDQKRDSLYVKDKNVWEKEDPENKKIKKAIKYISHKNICAIPEWKAKYPDCIFSDSLKSDQYNHIVLEAMGGSGDNDTEKADKIVKKIAKVVTIDKNN
jgi:hypothetical protein